MLGQRRRRWPNIEPALYPCVLFADLSPFFQYTYGHLLGFDQHFIYVCIDLQEPMPV